MYADEDKKKKEEVEVRNQVRNLIYETEKNLKDLNDKLTEEEKATITEAKDNLARTLENGTVDEIKENLEKLTEQFHTISAKMYQQTQGGEPDMNMGGTGDSGADANMGGDRAEQR
jgi:molecular chaperone DnaK